MIDVLKAWAQKHFSDPQAILLAAFLLFGSIILIYWVDVLVPVIASVVIAYVLEGLVKRISQFGMPRIISVIISFSVFISTAIILFWA